MATLAEILSEYWPTSEWTITGDDYSTLDWRGPGPIPTEAAIRTRTEETNAAQVARYVAQRHENRFRDAPDALLRALDIIIDGEIALKNKIDDLIDKLVGASIQGGKASLNPYDPQKVARIQQLRNKIDNIRSS